jgi:hypothetical protein
MEVINKRVKEREGPTSGVFVPLSPCAPNYTPGHDVQELKGRLWEARPIRVIVECSDIIHLHTSIGRNILPAGKISRSIQTMCAVNSNN